MDPREKSLPKWAQHVINDLCKRIEASQEPLLGELASLRSRVELLSARYEAMTELIQCAARGGHATSTEIVAIIEAFNLELRQKED